MWWMAVAFAANRWEGVDADVRVEVDVDLPAIQVTERLSDLRHVSTLFEEDCLTRWTLGIPDTGLQARARVTYTPSWMSRRLTLVVAEVDPGRWVGWDHEGARGFWAGFTVTENAAGTHVAMEIPLHPPPWPFRDLFHLKVKPAWEACMQEGLQRLDTNK